MWEHQGPCPPAGQPWGLSRLTPSGHKMKSPRLATLCLPDLSVPNSENTEFTGCGLSTYQTLGEQVVWAVVLHLPTPSEGGVLWPHFPPTV